LLLFKGSTILAATHLNSLTTSLQCSGNQLEAMYCLSFAQARVTSNNAIFFLLWCYPVSLSPFAPDGLKLEDLSNSKVINWSKFSLLYVVLSLILPQPNCLILQNVQSFILGMYSHFQGIFFSPQVLLNLWRRYRCCLFLLFNLHSWTMITSFYRNALRNHESLVLVMRNRFWERPKNLIVPLKAFKH